MHRRVDGKTFREFIREAMLEATANNSLIGATWWSELAVHFSAGTDPCAGIKPNNPDESLGSKLIESLDRIVDDSPCKRSEEPIISYFMHSTEPLNIGEMVGVLKSLSSLKIGACKRYDGVVVAILSHIRKTCSQDRIT